MFFDQKTLETIAGATSRLARLNDESLMRDMLLGKEWGFSILIF